MSKKKSITLSQDKMKEAIKRVSIQNQKRINSRTWLQNFIRKIKII